MYDYLIIKVSLKGIIKFVEPILLELTYKFKLELNIILNNTIINYSIHHLKKIKIVLNHFKLYTQKI